MGKVATPSSQSPDLGGSYLRPSPQWILALSSLLLRKMRSSQCRHWCVVNDVSSQDVTNTL